MGYQQRKMSREEYESFLKKGFGRFGWDAVIFVLLLAFFGLELLHDVVDKVFGIAKASVVLNAE